MSQISGPTPDIPRPSMVNAETSQVYQAPDTTQYFKNAIQALNNLADTLIPWIAAGDKLSTLMSGLAALLTVLNPNVPPSQITNSEMTSLLNLFNLLSHAEGSSKLPSKVTQAIDSFMNDSNVSQLYSDLQSLAAYESSVGSNPSTAQEQQIQSMVNNIINNDIPAVRSDPNEQSWYNKAELANMTLKTDVPMWAIQAKQLMNIIGSSITALSKCLDNITNQISGIETRI